MPEWMVYANFLLNTLIMPLLYVLWQIKNGLTQLETLVRTHHERLNRLERRQDAKNNE